MPFSHLPAVLSAWFSQLVGALDRRSAPRLLLLLLGALFARGRRTVTSWFRAAGITDDFRPAYNALWAAGRRAHALAYRLLGCVLLPLMRRVPGDHLLFALDDTPTPRYGPCVQGAGIHHNPTPGPAGEKFVYGHVWVTLAWLVRHPLGTRCRLPLRALLYVRAKDVPELAKALPLGVPHQAGTGRRTGPLADGLAGHARARPCGWSSTAPTPSGPSCGRCWRLGLVVFSRLRKDAALRSLPPTPAPARPARAAADLRQGQDRPGQAGRAKARLAAGGVRAVRQAGGQDDQDVRGDLAAGGGSHPRGDRARGRRLAGVLLHRPGGDGGDDPGGDGGSRRDRADVQGRQGGVGSGPAAGAQRLRQHRGVRGQPDAVQRGGGVGVAAPARRRWWTASRSPWDTEERRPSHADKRKALQREILREEIQAACGAASRAAGVSEPCHPPARIWPLECWIFAESTAPTASSTRSNRDAPAKSGPSRIVNGRIGGRNVRRSAHTLTSDQRTGRWRLACGRRSSDGSVQRSADSALGDPHVHPVPACRNCRVE